MFQYVLNIYFFNIFKLPISKKTIENIVWIHSIQVRIYHCGYVKLNLIVCTFMCLGVNIHERTRAQTHEKTRTSVQTRAHINTSTPTITYISTQTSTTYQCNQNYLYQ